MLKIQEYLHRRAKTGMGALFNSMASPQGQHKIIFSPEDTA